MITINGLNELVELLKEKEKFEDNDIKEVTNNLSKFIEKDIRSLDIYTFNKITDNSIYKIEINKEIKVIMKIRYEISFLTFEEEIKYLKLISNKDLIPKQYFFMNIKNQRLSVEEYVEGFHIEDGKTLLSNYLNNLTESLAAFHVSDFIEINKEDVFSREKFYYNFLSKAITHHGVVSFNEILKVFETTNNVKLIEYSESNREKIDFIKKFLSEKNTSQEKLVELVPSNSDHLVFSHNDIHNNNFLIDNNNKIKLIDFEDICFNFPGYDLANYIYESMFTFSDKYPYYIFNRAFMIFNEEQLLECFDNYLKKLKEKEKRITCNQFSLSDIYKLIAVSHLKAIYEYLFMFDINDAGSNQTEIDFIHAICEIIPSFYYFKCKLNDL